MKPVLVMPPQTAPHRTASDAAVNAFISCAQDGGVDDVSLQPDIGGNHRSGLERLFVRCAAFAHERAGIDEDFEFEKARVNTRPYEFVA